MDYLTLVLLLAVCVLNRASGEGPGQERGDPSVGSVVDDDVRVAPRACVITNESS